MGNLPKLELKLLVFMPRSKLRTY